jgi:hypothetical protein
MGTERRTLGCAVEKAPRAPSGEVSWKARSLPRRDDPLALSEEAVLPCAPLALALLLIGGPDSHLVAKIPDGCQVVPGSLQFSRDGAHCVCVATKDEKLHPVVDGTLGGAYDEVSWPTIDPSGGHTAFRVLERNPRKKVSTASVLYDGKILASDVWVGPLAIDPAKGAVAFWIAHGYSNTADGHLEPGAAMLLWGKYKSPKFQFVDYLSPPKFAPDGKLLVTTAARSSGDWNVITIDDKGKDDKHGNGSIFEAVLRPTGHAVAYTFANLFGSENWMSREQHFLVTTASLDEHGEKSAIAIFGEKYASSGSPVFTPDGLHLAYKVTNGAKMGAAIDDQKDAPCEFDFVDELSPKPNGSEVALLGCNGCKLDAKFGREVLCGVHASGGTWSVVHGSARFGTYDLARCPTWSPDGKGFAYAAKKAGKWCVFAGAKTSDACDDVACIAWADDGGSLFYGCRDGAEVWWRKLEAQ